MGLENNHAFVYIMLLLLGLGISITFGCFVQMITMFPPSMHPFFFIGTYSPFLIFAPTNVAVKDLCIKQVHVSVACVFMCVCVCEYVCECLCLARAFVCTQRLVLIPLLACSPAP